jgi:hypothetical protein
MREHYLTYLQVIKDRYLGRKWQLRENIKFEQQSFRQRGHEDETPQMFLGRRVRAVRMLANSDDSGLLEVFLVMRKAPIKWSTILVLENIQLTEELYDKISEDDESLIDAVRNQAHDAVTVGNLASTLKCLGYGPTAPSNPRSFRRVNVAETGDQGLEEAEEVDGSANLQNLGMEDGTETMKQVYQALKKRQRPPPKGGYPFAKNDHVTTKMGRVPPSPCKVCGSANHWDRECPDWNIYLEKQNRGVLTVVSSPTAEESEMMYHSAYCVLLEGHVSEPSF